MTALKKVNLLDQVLVLSVKMRGRIIHSIDGNTIYQPYGKNENEVLHSVDRNELNKLLVETAEQYPNLQLFFEHKLVNINNVLAK